MAGASFCADFPAAAGQCIFSQGVIPVIFILCKKSVLYKCINQTGKRGLAKNFYLCYYRNNDNLMDEGAMTREEIIKKEILKQYKSVRKFAFDAGIPYSSLATAFDRGITGMRFDTVIQICKKLGINPVDFTLIKEDGSLSEEGIIEYYRKLSSEDQDSLNHMEE